MQKQLRVASGATVRRYASVNKANLCSMSEAALSYIYISRLYSLCFTTMFVLFYYGMIVFVHTRLWDAHG